MKANLELDFSYLEGGAEDEIIRRAARLLLEQESKKMKGIISGFRNQLSQIREEMLRERLTPIIEEAVSAPIHKTNEFGESRGEPVTLREFIVSYIQQQLTVKRESHYGRPRETIVEKIIRDELEGSLKKTIQEAMTAAAKAAREAVEKRAAEVIRETISRVSSKL